MAQPSLKPGKPKTPNAAEGGGIFPAQTTRFVRPTSQSMISPQWQLCFQMRNRLKAKEAAAPFLRHRQHMSQVILAQSSFGQSSFGQSSFGKTTETDFKLIPSESCFYS